MAQLSGKEMCYKAIDGGSTDPAHREKLLTNFMAPAELKVRLDSQVMLIKNMDETLVNGSVGKVVGFCDPSCFVGVNPETGEIIRNDATIDVNTKEGKKAWERKQKLIDEGKIEDAPVVKFQPVRSQNPRYECFAREPFKVELPGGEVQASRAQVSRFLLWEVAILMCAAPSIPISFHGLCQSTSLKVRLWTMSKLIWVGYSRRVRTTCIKAFQIAHIWYLRTSICGPIPRNLSGGLAGA